MWTVLVALAWGDEPVIDLHAHLIMVGAPGEREAYLANAADPRIDRIAAIVMAPRGDLDTTRAQNDQALALQTSDPRVIAVCSVHPLDHRAALRELDRIAGLGCRFLKLHQNTQRFDLEEPWVGRVLGAAGEHGMTVLIEGTTVLDAETFGKVLVHAIGNPTTRILLTHMGHADFAQAMVFAEMRHFAWYPDNVYFDISATAPTFVDSPFEDELVWVIRQLGSRVVFGSDFPVHTTADAIDAVLRLDLTPEERRALLHDNAAALLSR
jgi:uncharacterized protein